MSRGRALRGEASSAAAQPVSAWMMERASAFRAHCEGTLGPAADELWPSHTARMNHVVLWSTMRSGVLECYIIAQRCREPAIPAPPSPQQPGRLLPHGLAKGAWSLRRVTRAVGCAESGGPRGGAWVLPYNASTF